MEALDQERLPECARNLQHSDVLENPTARQRHVIDVLLGLLYLACGGLDEAHALVTPHSWPSSTSFAGAPIRNSPVAKQATYAHAMVHRAEGEHVGEYGTGWNNSNYWFGTLGSHFLYATILAEAKSLNNTEINFPNLESWSPAEFNDFCESTVKSGDIKKLEFCQKLINHEWRLLFDHCWSLL